MTINKTKILGQYFTPSNLANDIVSATRRFYTKDTLSVLEPAFGEGAFCDALKVSNIPFDDFYGIEIDNSLSTNGATENVHIEYTDFTNKLPQKQYDLILTNPPYTRHQLIPKTQKEQMALQIWEELGITINQLSGLHCYFVFLADKWLKEDGIAVWLLPSEFLDINYGKELKNYLVNNVQLLQVHIYDTENSSLFNSATVSSCVIVYRKKKPRASETILFTYGHSMERPDAQKSVVREALTPDVKWTKIFTQTSIAEKDSGKLSDYFFIKRGIATGYNDYFILSKEEIERRDLPYECFTPILVNQRDIDCQIVENDLDGLPITKKCKYVLDTNLSLMEIALKFPKLYAYLQYGEELGVKQRYLVKKRRIWYKQEIRTPAPYYCTYIARNENGNFFHFIWNKSNLIVTNNFLMLYPKPSLSYALEQGNITLHDVYAALLKIDTKTFLRESRQYATGMSKLEPSELGNVAIQLAL